jgi:hypothetical protein
LIDLFRSATIAIARKPEDMPVSDVQVGDSSRKSGDEFDTEATEELNTQQGTLQANSWPSAKLK